MFFFFFFFWGSGFIFLFYIFFKYFTDGYNCERLGGCLVYVFKQQFSVFKQHFTYFKALFHPHVFPQMFLNNNFQFLNTHTKRALEDSVLYIENLAHKILKLLVHAILLMVSYAFLFIISFLIVSSQFEGTFDGVPIGVICLIGRGRGRGRGLLKIIRTYRVRLD